MLWLFLYLSIGLMAFGFRRKSISEHLNSIYEKNYRNRGPGYRAFDAALLTTMWMLFWPILWILWIGYED